MKLFLFLLLFPIFLYSQNRDISGKITDSSGEGIPSATITLKGTTNGTISDTDGNYRINVPEGKAATLVFSFIGFISQEIEVGSNNTINVILTSDNIGLEEVIA